MSESKPNIIPLPAHSWSRRWTKTRFSNLIRYRSGTFYAYAKVGGKKIQRSLKTKSLTIAKIRLDALLAQERGVVVSVRLDPGKTTMQNVINAWLTQVRNDPELKPTSKLYKQDLVKAIRRTWIELDSLRPEQITQSTLETWATQFRAKYSPTRFNGARQALQDILAFALRRGLVASNPIDHVNRASVPTKARQMPSQAKFRAVLKLLESKPAGVPAKLLPATLTRRRNALLMVKFLAYSGMRIGAARAVQVSDVDLKRNELVLPPIKYQDQPARLPMSAELRATVQELLRVHPGSGPLLQVQNPRKALANACAEAGVPRLTNHDLRRLFITRCLECGIDVATVALWAGHKDGGSLILKTYAKIRNEHSHQMMKRLKW